MNTEVDYLAIYGTSKEPLDKGNKIYTEKIILQDLTYIIVKFGKDEDEEPKRRVSFTTVKGWE